MSSHQGRPKRP